MEARKRELAIRPKTTELYFRFQGAANRRRREREERETMESKFREETSKHRHRGLPNQLEVEEKQLESIEKVERMQKKEEKEGVEAESSTDMNRERTNA